MMPSPIPRLAVAGALALAGQALAGQALAYDTRPVDAYLAITGLAPGGRVPAGAPCPLDARVVTLGEGTAVVYYTYDEEGGDALRVVTTVVAGPGGSAAPARFVSHLTPGQRAEVSAAGAAGAGPAALELELELAYDGGRLVVRPVPVGVQAGPQG